MAKGCRRMMVMVVPALLALGAAAPGWAQFPPKAEPLDIEMLGDPMGMIRAHDYGGILYPSERYLKYHPQSWGARWYMAGAYYFNNQHDRAIEAYGILLKDMPQRPDLLAMVHYWRGRSYLGVGDFAGARESFRACLGTGDLSQLKGQSPHLHAGGSAVSTGAFEAALPLLETHLSATKEASLLAQGLLWKCRALRGLGRGEAALAAVEEAVAVHLKRYPPVPLEILLQRAQCLAEAGAKDRALIDLDAILKEGPFPYYDDRVKLYDRAKALREALQPAPVAAMPARPVKRSKIPPKS